MHQAEYEGLSVILEPIPAPQTLAPIWLELEARAEASFFTSWTWIGTWLETLAISGAGEDLFLVKICDRTTVVGLGVVCRGPQSWRSLGQRSWILHQTGRPSLDSIYIEYNDFLVSASAAPAARRAAIRHLGATMPIRAAAGLPAVADALAATALSHRIVRQEDCGYIDLSRFSNGAPSGDDSHFSGTINAILETLERDPRQQIRRAIRLAEKEGPLQVTRAPDVEAAKQDLAALVDLHAKAWSSRKGRPGAFANADLVRFIARLVEVGTGPGVVDILRIGAPGQVLGYLLNFVHRGHVYAYQSGFVYVDDNRHKPGLVCHILAAAFYRERGCAGYHFMAGAARYKRALSNAEETLLWLESRPDNMLSRVEDLCRTLWQAFKRIKN